LAKYLVGKNHKCFHEIKGQEFVRIYHLIIYFYVSWERPFLVCLFDYLEGCSNYKKQI